MTWLLNLLCKQLDLDNQAYLRRIEGDHTHNVFLLQSDRCRFAVKLFDGENLSTNSRKTQFEVQIKLAENGIAPKPIWLSDDERIWVEEWLEKEQSNSTLSLSKALTAVHNQQINIPRLDLHAAWNRYITIAGLSNEHPLVLESNKLGAWMSDQNNNRQYDTEIVVCHHDLALAHIMCEDPLQLIDWEYAGAGNRFFDLALCGEINQLDRGGVEALAIHYADYFDFDSDYVKARITSYMPSVHLTQKLWHAAKQKLAE